MNSHAHRLVFSRTRGCCIAVAETAKAAGKSASGERRSRVARASAAAALAVAALGAQAQGLPAGVAAPAGVAPKPSVRPGGVSTSVLPTGATVVKGSGSISVNGADMTVNQSSQRLVTDWQSFSIGPDNSVRFVQPSSSSVALNRVTGDDASNIFGSLTANGHVYLQNANGVYFAPGAQVSVGSLVATSLNVDVDQLMLGKLRLSGGNESSGAVSNAGGIVAAPGGHVVLAGPVVSNSGSISTPGGTTVLAAGNAVDIDPLGSGLLSVSVPVAAVNARLAQSGTIAADGGAVQLAAAATDAAVRTVMQVGGIVRARSIEQRDGQIVLSGGSSGMVIVDGQLDATGGAAGQGGTIKVLGDRVGLTGTARVDASGGSGGGTILVGGNWQGKGTEQNATNTYVGSGVVLDASATGNGDGGKVVVWADGHTSYAGQLQARGGAAGGDGGQAEVSGKQTLDFQGGADLSARRGAVGRLLLDPSSLNIGTTANVNGDATTGDDLPGSTLLATDFGGAASQITATRVATLLATTDVTLASSISLGVSAPLTVAAGGAATTLSLTSGNITIGSPMTLNNASLTASTTPITSPSVVVNAPVSSLASITLTAPIVTVGATGSLNANTMALTGSTINVNGAINATTAMTLTGTTINLNAPSTAPAISLLTNNNFAFTSIQQDAAGVGVVNAGSLTVDAAAGFSVPDSIDLSFANNKIGTLVVNAGDASFRVANNAGVPLVMSGTVPFGFTVAGVNTNITQPTGAVGALTIGAGEGAFDVSTTGSGNVTLTNPANTFNGVSFNVAGNVDIVAATSLGASGTATGNVTLAALGGSFFLNDTISAANVDISGVGFNNFTSGVAFNVPATGRFTIRSSDFTQDNFGTLGFGVAAGSVNYIVYGGYTGVAPTTGNGLFTNRTGSLTPPNADDPPISKVYDGTPNFAYAQTGTASAGLLNGGTPTALALTNYTVNGSGVFGTGAPADKNAGVNKGLTVAASNNTSAVSPSQNGAVLYGLQFAGYTRAPGPYVVGAPGNAISQITPKPITASGIDGVDRVYDATTAVALNAAGGALAGTIAGDNVNLVTATATGTLANKNVGVNKAVTVVGLALGGTDAGNYTVSDASGATSTITARPITSTGFAGVDRAYNGTTGVAANGAGASLTGVLGGDVVTVAAGGATGTMADKNVGVGKAVAITGVGLGGTDAGNYTVTDASGAVVTITPLGITSTGITGVDRNYDGTTAVAVNAGAAALNGAIAGDNVSLVASAATGAMADKNAGNAKPVAVGGLTLAGTDAVNYSLVDASNATVNIAAAVLQASGITAVNKVADGTNTVQLDTSNVSVTGVVPGDTVGVDASGAVGSVATPDAGVAKPVTVIGIDLTGPDAINYAISPFPIVAGGGGLTVRFFIAAQGRFDDIRFKEYLEAVSDAQEPFRRAMMEALLAGFGKENIRKQLQRGLVFETGLAPPAVDIIEPAAKPDSCTPPGADLTCGR
ncbi:MAG: YDG domain-containing protein [Caldimonas sp.]